MSQLAGNAKIDGRRGEALDWYERAYRESKGPATRLQWGASYVAALFELAPDDAARIEKAVGEVLTEASRDKGAMYDRSQRSLKKIAARSAAWKNQAVRARLRARFAELCRPLGAGDAQRTTCDALWPA